MYGEYGVKDTQHESRNTELSGGKIMSEISEEKQSRREFIQSFVRYLILGGLFSMAGFLFARREKSSKKDCVSPDICRNCSLLKKCDLPAALSAKK